MIPRLRRQGLQGGGHVGSRHHTSHRSEVPRLPKATKRPNRLSTRQALVGLTAFTAPGSPENVRLSQAPQVLGVIGNVGSRGPQCAPPGCCKKTADSTRIATCQGAVLSSCPQGTVRTRELNKGLSITRCFFVIHLLYQAWQDLEKTLKDQGIWNMKEDDPEGVHPVIRGMIMDRV